MDIFSTIIITIFLLSATTGEQSPLMAKASIYFNYVTMSLLKGKKNIGKNITELKADNKKKGKGTGGK